MEEELPTLSLSLPFSACLADDFFTPLLLVALALLPREDDLGVKSSCMIKCYGSCILTYHFHCILCQLHGVLWTTSWTVAVAIELTATT